MRLLNFIGTVFYISLAVDMVLALWSAVAVKHGPIAKERADKYFWIVFIITCAIGTIWGLVGGLR